MRRIAFVAAALLYATAALAQIAGIPAEHIAGIKKSEGFSACAYWDYAQHSIGYGTKAKSADECIDEEEATNRFAVEITKAAEFVDSVSTRLDPGTRAALVSLTYNAGPSWGRSALGDRIRAGDLDGARRIFLQYNKAGGSQLAGLVARREREAVWFGAAPRIAAPAPQECRMPDGRVGLMRSVSP